MRALTLDALRFISLEVDKSMQRQGTYFGLICRP